MKMASKSKHWHKLTNGYWLKVLFIKLTGYYNLWAVDIAVGKTKRIVNDHYNKTKKSPKTLYNKSSNNKGGLEALKITLQDIQDFVKSLPGNNTILVNGSDEQRIHVYSRLLHHGFIQASYFVPEKVWHKDIYYFLEVKNGVDKNGGEKQKGRKRFSR
jgi:hypothetical protein